MRNLITILLILVSTCVFSQEETPIHIEKLEKEYKFHKTMAWSSLSTTTVFYGMGATAHLKEDNFMIIPSQQVIMGTFVVTLNVNAVYHFLKARKIKKKIYIEKYIINVYE